MKSLVAASFLLFATGCALLESEQDTIEVKVSNETQMRFTQVVLNLGGSDEDAVRFGNLLPGDRTPLRAVRHAFQHYTVHAETEGRELVFAVNAFVAIALEPGRYTYRLTIDEEGRLIVNRTREP